MSTGRGRISFSRACQAPCCRQVARLSRPIAAGQYTVDAVTASTAFEGVLAALLHRERTGEGQLVSVNMLDAITTLQMQELSVFTVSGKPQERSAEPHAHVYIRSPYGAFATQDSYIIVAFPKLKTFGALIGEPVFETMDDEIDTWTQRDLDFRANARAVEGEDDNGMAGAVPS